MLPIESRSNVIQALWVPSPVLISVALLKHVYLSTAPLMRTKPSTVTQEEVGGIEATYTTTEQVVVHLLKVRDPSLVLCHTDP